VRSWKLIYGAVVEMVERVRLGGFVERVRGLRERQEARCRSSRFHNRQRWQAAEAARFAFSRLWCLGGLMMESRALRADIRGAIRDEKFPLAVEKMAPLVCHTSCII